MQTNTKAKPQTKSISWVLTPEIMALSILLVAALVITITVLRDTSSLEPLADIKPMSFSQTDLEDAQLMNDTFDSKNPNYAQHLDTSKSEEITSFSS